MFRVWATFQFRQTPLSFIMVAAAAVALRRQVSTVGPTKLSFSKVPKKPLLNVNRIPSGAERSAL